MAEIKIVPERRGIVFVKKRFQIVLAFWYLLVIAPVSFGLGWLLHRRLLAVLNHSMFMGHSKFSNTWEIFRHPVLSITLVGVTLTIVVASLVTFIIFRIINRWCHRLSLTIAAVGSGDHRDAGTFAVSREFRQIATEIWRIEKSHTRHVTVTETLLANLRQSAEAASDEVAKGVFEGARIEELLRLTTGLGKVPGDVRLPGDLTP